MNDFAGEIVSPVPPHAPRKPVEHSELGRPSHVWPYPDADGELLFEIWRFDQPDGGKEYRPLSLWRSARGLRWQWKGFPEPRPIYGLDRLAARIDAPVIVCEGEVSRCGGGNLSG